MENLTAELGRSLAALRARAGLKQRELAELVTKSGHRMALSTVSKIENGDRVMGIADLLAFSRALRVPPALLLIPAWRDPAVDVGGKQVKSWRAVQWISGRRPLHDGESFAPPAGVITLNIQHDDLTRRYEEALGEKWYLDNQHLLDGPADEGESREPIELQRRIRVLLRDLRQIRALMRQHDFPLPVLPEGMEHVDDETYLYRTDTELATAILVEERTGRPVDFREQSS